VFTPLIASGHINAARVGLLVVVLCMLCIQLVARPYARELNNSLELFGFAVLITLVGINSIDARSLTDEKMQSAMSISLLAIAAVVLFMPSIVDVVQTVWQR